MTSCETPQLRLAVGWSLVFGLGGYLAAGEIPYPRAELLIQPAALAQGPGLRHFVVLDARPREQYDRGRIPGAVWVDAAAWAKAFGDGADTAGWSARIGSLGIASDAKVVVYDDASFKDAARVWWILKYWGLEDVRLLNGNWTGWKGAGLPIETDAPKPPPPTKFVAAARRPRLATKDRLLEALKDNSLQIVDSRSHAEFCGIDQQKNQQKNKRAGAIPGAKHLEWTDLIDKPTQRFKTAAELRLLFQAAGIDLQRGTATYCQSGGRASVMAFAMEPMGAANVANYYASWAEWGNADDTPVELPQPPKKL